MQINEPHYIITYYYTLFNNLYGYMLLKMYMFCQDPFWVKIGIMTIDI